MSVATAEFRVMYSLNSNTHSMGLTDWSLCFLGNRCALSIDGHSGAAGSVPKNTPRCLRHELFGLDITTNHFHLHVLNYHRATLPQIANSYRIASSSTTHPYQQAKLRAGSFTAEKADAVTGST
jgi:hypothetical protein